MSSLEIDNLLAQFPDLDAPVGSWVEPEVTYDSSIVHPPVDAYWNSDKELMKFFSVPGKPVENLEYLRFTAALSTQEVNYYMTADLTGK